MLTPSHFGNSAVLVAAAAVLVTIVVTVLVRFRTPQADEASHKKHLNSVMIWGTGVLLSVLALILALLDDHHAAPSGLNRFAAIAIGVIAAFVLWLCVKSDWSDARHAKFFAFGMLSILNAVLSLAANFYLYALDRAHPFQTMIVDGALASELTLTVLFGGIAVFFGFGGTGRRRRTEV